jgi:predicted phosphodiesterase
MRILIISDIHANLTALEAVLADAEPFDQVWCLGDVVGYGPDPNECIERVRVLPHLRCVLGNHDAAILGQIDINAFNDEARRSLEWLQTTLESENRSWLAGLADFLEFDDITIAHGSPRDPIWEYIMDVNIARQNMDAFTTKICLVGHSHFPTVFKMDGDRKSTTHLYLIPPERSFTLDRKSIVNPGSVGQPRDRDPRASYLIYEDDDDTWMYHRTPYDVEAVQRRILAAGLPIRHAARLAEGW